MKVIAVNGSPHKEGNTYHAIRVVADELEKEGIEVEIMHVGNKAVRGCTACGMCRKNADGKCIFDDQVNEAIQKMKEADGLLIGSPVYYSGIAGTMKSFLDRLFYAGAANKIFRHKVGAAVAAVRRSGGMPTFNGLNHYLAISEMIMPGSTYWNVVHGTKPGDALKDTEGVQTMETLGKNMAFLINELKDSKKPEAVKKTYTSFIR